MHGTRDPNEDKGYIMHIDNPLHQVIYLSHLTVKEDSIGNILEAALRHNPRHDITGMMLYSGGDVLQVLEGPKNPVLDLFEKIKLDARHTEVFTVLNEPLAARHFPQWTMGYKKLRESDKFDFLHYQQVFKGTPDAIAMRSRSGVAIDVINAFCTWAMSR